jgi:CSLREA domain-containing protein
VSTKTHSRPLAPLRLIAVGSFLAVAVLWVAPIARGDTFVVTRRTDPVPGACTKSDCSLREAVRAANAHPGADRILLPSRRPYTLQRPSTTEDGALDGDLDITNDPLQIVHPGKGRATIDANGIDRVFHIFVGAPTTLLRLKITGGSHGSGSEGDGGAILTFANLRIVDSAVVGNRAFGSSGSGGGIEADDGKLTILHSSISYNRADDSSGALEVGNHALVIKGSTIVGNHANFAGAGYMYGDGASRIERTTIAKNRSASETGGIYFSESAGTLTILRSTISGNVAASDAGGISFRNGTVSMVNSTVSGNRAGASGGGVWALTPVKLNSVTIARNVADSDSTGGGEGAGLFKAGTGFLVEVENSLIALNRRGDGALSDCLGEDPIDSLGHNLISSTGPAGACAGFDEPGDKVRSNPKIGQLKKNGGPTKTIKLLKGSPAINAADRNTSPGRDQRGVKRRKADIGAFELRPR